MLAVAVLKFLIISEQGALHFGLALAPTDYSASPEPSPPGNQKAEFIQVSPWGTEQGGEVGGGLGVPKEDIQPSSDCYRDN